MVLIGPLEVHTGSDWATGGSQLVTDGSAEKSWYAPIILIGESRLCSDWMTSGMSEVVIGCSLDLGAQKCFRLDDEPSESLTSVTL
ncbi:uncharacterized [Tachysurus ichikawai]